MYGVVKEARVHFVDAIEDALQHGLTVDAAERESFDRSGTPETVASQFGAERHATLRRFLFVVEKTRLSATRRGGVWRRPAGRRCGTPFIQRTTSRRRCRASPNVSGTP